MDSDEFDAVTRRLSVAATRRGVLGVLAGVVSLSLEEVAAKRWHGGKRHGKGQHAEKHHAKASAAGSKCVKDGGVCDPQTPNCCNNLMCDDTIPVPTCVKVSTKPSQCPAGQVKCKGACTDLTSDPNNCGVCGSVCSSGKSCQGGQCLCPTGELECGGQCSPTCGAGVCIDFTTNPDHCGTCGNACTGVASFCVQGQCQCDRATCSGQDNACVTCACIRNVVCLCTHSSCPGDTVCDPDTGCPS
jgi:hypothetical protein